MKKKNIFILFATIAMISCSNKSTELDIQSHWQGGLLDIDNYLTEGLGAWMKGYNKTYNKI